jgi:hypothetical protein
LTERFDTLIRRRRRCAKCRGEFYTSEQFLGIIKPPPTWDPRKGLAVSPAPTGQQVQLLVITR